VNAAATEGHSEAADEGRAGPLWLRPLDQLAERGGRVGALAGWANQSLPLGCVVRFFMISGRDRVLVMGGQAFTAVIPLAIVTAAFASSDDAVAKNLVSRFHLTGTAAEAVNTLFSRPPGAAGTITLIGFVVLVFSVISLARYMQRTYEVAWGLPPAGLRGTLDGVSGLGLLLGQIIVLSLIGGLVSRGPAGGFLSLVVHLVVASVLWLQLQYLLLSRRVARRSLLPGAVVAGVGQAAVTIYSAVFMPHILQVDSERYGVIGVTFALLTWLIVVSACVVMAAVVSAEFGHRRGFHLLRQRP
jgi:membrane protein